MCSSRGDFSEGWQWELLDTLGFTELLCDVVKMLILVNWCLQMFLKGEFRLNVGNGSFSITSARRFHSLIQTTLANAGCFEDFFLTL